MSILDISLPPKIYPILGIKIGTTAAGVRYQNRDDLVVFELAESSQTAVVTTQNSFCAAPVQLLHKHISKAKPKYLVINTGNANAATGQKGLDAAKKICDYLAKITEIDTHAVLPFSTGVIGEPLNTAAIINGLSAAIKDLNSQPKSLNKPKLNAVTYADSASWIRAANAILTTDTIAKVASVKRTINGVDYHITGIAKGSGMIRPNMATMLSFVATDAHIEPTLLKRIQKSIVDRSFNRITVDGDTSTNDCSVLIATAKAANKDKMPFIDSVEHPDYDSLYEAILQISLQLAKFIVKDGEGASKFITINVTGGATIQECCDVAYTVAHSPLVKTAFFASDPNWGRIVAAVGNAGVQNLEPAKISVSLDDVPICVHGEIAEDYSEDKGQTVMRRPEITINIELGRGNCKDTVYTCDLSYDYIKINSDYRS